MLSMRRQQHLVVMLGFSRHPVRWEVQSSEWAKTYLREEKGRTHKGPGDLYGRSKMRWEGSRRTLDIIGSG